MSEVITFEDEVELKKFLDSVKYRFGEIACNDKYVIYFRDVKSGAPISQGIYDSPIVALRDLSVIIPQIKIPIEDVMCQLLLCFNPSDGKKKPIQFDDVIVLSPYMYFKKKEIQNGEVKATSDAADATEDNTK